ncbi:MAG TPA: hypothetical protein VH877_07055 [Polyangia bacterium]|jgi:hypothetical protein|nr:hypothetical protein [Polyangia bacterium]
MANYLKLRDFVSHRVTFEYDTGAKVVGYLAACKPPTGPVQVVILSRADILDANGRVIEHHDEMSLVPNLMVSYRLTEGPSAAA